MENKLMIPVFAAALLLQQNCDMSKISGNTAAQVDQQLVARIRGSFPNAMAERNGQTTVVHTGAFGVSQELVRQIAQQMGPQFAAAQQDFRTIIAQALGGFPREIRFLFNEPKCGEPPTMQLTLTYSVQAGRIDMAGFAPRPAPNCGSLSTGNDSEVNRKQIIRVLRKTLQISPPIAQTTSNASMTG